MSSAETMGFIRFFIQRNFNHVISGVFWRDCFLSAALQYNKTNMDYVTHFILLYRLFLKNFHRTVNKNVIKSMTVKRFSLWRDAVKTTWCYNVIFCLFTKNNVPNLQYIKWRLNSDDPVYVYNIHIYLFVIFGAKVFWLKWLTVECKYTLWLVSTCLLF